MKTNSGVFIKPERTGKILMGIFFLLISYACSDRPNTRIKGTVNNHEREYIYLDYLDINKTLTLDSVKLKKDGSFQFRFRVGHAGLYLLRNEEGKIINLLPFPGDELELTINGEKFGQAYSVKGSQESENIRQLVDKLQFTRSELSKLDSVYSSFSNITQQQASDYIARRKAIIQDQRDFTIQFIIEHLNSISSIYAIYQEISEGQYVLSENRDIQYMKIVADSVSNRYPDNPFVRSFVEDARANEREYYNLQELGKLMKDAKTGLPDLQIPDTEGDTIKLSEVNADLIYLYFWSSFSEPSRNINPQLKSIYEKNKNKGFEVYAVSLDSEKRDWLNAIRFDELNWINVSELSFPNSKASAIYNVRSLPSSYLLNGNGEILARDIYGAELQKWLDNILK